MAAFRATERDALATQYGEEDADAAINRIEKRLEKLKTLQVLEMKWNETIMSKIYPTVSTD